jgi:chemotaxis response regulator CheB
MRLASDPPIRIVPAMCRRESGVAAIKVLIVDDSVTIRAMLEQVLGNEPDFVLVGSAADAESARRMVHQFHPDVVTIDIAMPGKDGLSLLDEVHLQTHAVMLTSRCEAAGDSFERGAFGFFNKAHILTDARKLVKMVRAAAEGKLTRKAA